MFRNPFKGFPGEVQAVELRVMAFQMRHDPDRLRVVIEPTVRGHRRRQRVLARVPERRMSQIMGQRHGLRQVLVQTQRAGHGARHLRHLQRMGQTGAEIVALMLHEDLRLVLEPAKRGGVDDPVAIPLKGRAKEALLLRHTAATALGRVAGERRAHGQAPGKALMTRGRDLFGPPLPHIFTPSENRPLRPRMHFQ
jgi:hypothetical protein